MSITSTDPQTRRMERAIQQFHSYSYQPATLTLHTQDGRTEKRGLVYILPKNGDSHYTVGLNRNLVPTSCDCEDAKRNPSLACKHRLMSEMFLKGEVPEPNPPAFDIDAEGALLAKLEESERLARAERDRCLWD